MSNDGAAPRAAAAAPGAPRGAATPVSHGRAEASRRNGARWRGPKTPDGKARAAQNALKHGLRAQKHVVLPQEDAAEFAQFQAALLEELAPVGVMQTVLARRIVIAAWRLAHADRMEVEVLEFRSYDGANPGLALLGRRVGERGPNPVPAAKGRQRHARARDAPALPQRAMAEFARAQDAAGAPGRAGGRSRSCARDTRHAACRAAAPSRAAPEHRPSAPTERSRTRRAAPAGLRPD
jgi:hypothetical protein